MTLRFAIRSLAACLILAAFALAPQPAQARWHGGFGGFHGGGFRGGFGGFRGGFYGGGLGRGFYSGGFYPRYYRGYYPGFYGGLGLGLGLGYASNYYGGYSPYYGGYGYPSYYGGGYGYPVSYGGYGYPMNYGYGYGCSTNGINSYTTTIVANPTASTLPTTVVSTNALPAAAASQFQYYLANNPYRQQLNRPQPPLIAAQPANDLPVLTAGYENPYRSTSNTKIVEPPPLPGL